METIRASEALKSRARAIREELTDMLTIALAKAAARRQPDPAAKLAASLLVLAIIDQGTRGLKAAVQGFPYA